MFNRSGAKNNEIYNIVINGHGLIDSNKFIIIPNNTSWTFAGAFKKVPKYVTII